MVEPGHKVQVHYKGTLTDGTVFDTSEGRDPLEFEVGTGAVISGFEQGVLGMEEGETKRIQVPCAEAYGEVRKEMIADVPREQLPPTIQPEVGMMLEMQTSDGALPVKVAEVTDSEVILDGNHPLAGKDLEFELTVVSIR